MVLLVLCKTTIILLLVMILPQEKGLGILSPSLQPAKPWTHTCEYSAIMWYKYVKKGNEEGKKRNVSQIELFIALFL